jgi:fatty acid-binding protein DegV
LKFLEEIKPRITLKAVTPNIDFLRKSGRVSHLMTMLGQALNVAPIVQIDNNKVNKAGMVRRYGSDESKINSKAKEQMIIDLRKGDPPQQIAILDLGARDVVDELKQ